MKFLCYFGNWFIKASSGIVHFCIKNYAFFHIQKGLFINIYMEDMIIMLMFPRNFLDSLIFETNSLFPLGMTISITSSNLRRSRISSLKDTRLISFFPIDLGNSPMTALWNTTFVKT